MQTKITFLALPFIDQLQISFILWQKSNIEGYLMLNPLL